MKKILIIEDDFLVQKDLQYLLKNNNYEVLLADDGTEGIRKALVEKPDLIICDINMPNKNGYEVLEALQNDEQTLMIPFLFLTAQADIKEQRHGYFAGADDYIVKPYDKDDLLSSIESRIKKYSLILENYEKRLKSLERYVTLTLPHELRTPLTTIMLYSEILMKNFKDIPESELNGIFLNINKAGKRLLRLISNYIFYNQLLHIEQEKNQPQGIEFNSIEAIMMMVEKIAEIYSGKHRIKYDLQSNAIVMSMEYFLKMVEELTDNAFKFSNENSDIYISSKSEGKIFKLIIKNYGRGFTQGEISKIDAFSQFKRKEYEQQGIGLGLAITLKIAGIYGGTVDIHSIPGIEARIEVSLPVA